MYDRMSDPCRDAFKAAHKIARACGRNVLETDSILLGLTQAREPSPATRVMRETGLWGKLVDRVEAMGPLPRGFSVPFIQSEQARQCVEAADAYTVELDHHYIGTEHIFLGMIGRCDLLDKVSKELGVDVDDLRRSTYNLLGVDTNTESDYKKHFDRIGGILSGSIDCRKSVREVAEYLRANVPR